MPAALFLKDLDARYLLINRQFQDWFGVDPEDIIGKDVYDLYPAERADRYAAGDREMLRTWKVVRDELEIPITSGGLLTFTLTKFPILDGDKGVGFGGVMIDTTERTLAERALRESEREAELANRAKSDFLANVCHELRTPLNAIIGFSEIIEQQLLGPVGNSRYHEYAGDIHESGLHLLDLINDILDLSKIESGSDESIEEDVDIAEIVASVATLVGGRAETGDVRLELELPDALPAIRIDPRRLKQILVNLVVNGIKFTAPGGRVSLKAWFRRQSGFVFQIADTGIGIAPADIPKALTPFGQVDSRPNQKSQGIGLPLTKRLVEMQAGSRDLASEVGVGTTVTVRYPTDRMVPAERTAWAASE